MPLLTLLAKPPTKNARLSVRTAKLSVSCTETSGECARAPLAFLNHACNLSAATPPTQDTDARMFDPTQLHMAATDPKPMANKLQPLTDGQQAPN